MDVQNANAVQGVQMDDVEALLDDLDLGDNDQVELEAVEEEVVEASGEEEVVSEELADGEIADLDLQLAKDEVYEEQEAKSDTDMEAPAAAAAAQAANPPKKGKAAGAKKSATPAAPRTARDLNSVDASLFVLEGDAAAFDQAQLDANKATVMGTIPAQKKIAEKFENLFTSLAAGKQPSVYVVQAFKLLDEKKSITSADIVASFKGSYKQGTAMSQSGQIMKLFDTVKIASRTGNKLVLNDNSTVADRIRQAITKP